MDKPHHYKNAMAQVQFDPQFEKHTLERIAAQKKRRKKRLIVCFAAAGCAAAAAITVIAVFAAGNPQYKPQIAQASAPASSAAYAAITTSAATPAATPDTRIVAVSSEYGGGELDSYISPKPGQAVIAVGIQRALDDAAGEGTYFFVQISILAPEQYANRFGDYIYNGRSIDEWRELIDLANGTYPYGEYKGDHGGNITREQWRAAQEEAKTLDAQANCDTAAAKYNEEIAPMLAKAKSEREQNECARLQSIGYDVFLSDTWAYTGAAEKECYGIFAGVLSAEQLTGFAADAQCGYFIDWVYCGNGVVDWNEALRPQG